MTSRASFMPLSIDWESLLRNPGRTSLGREREAAPGKGTGFSA